MKVIVSTVCFCLFALGLAQTIQAQDQIANNASAAGGDGSTQQDGLNGQVRRVRVETANLLVREGKILEGPRVVREITTYDQKGKKIDSVAYPASDSTAVGNKQQYLYDGKGNIIEMVALQDDGHILNKEKYEYLFDEFGNWKKMTASIAVFENRVISYEPFEIAYRTITYYYVQSAPKVVTPPTLMSISNSSTTETATGVAQINKPSSDAPVSIAATAISTSDDKKTSDAAEAIAEKPEESEPSNTVPAAVTPKDNASKLPVIHVSEEALRKAAIELPQPQYPEAAKVKGAEGNVEVQILIDEMGDVIDASALSGDPLFREVAEAAARRAKFSLVKLSPDPARIYGVINYTFTLPGNQSPAANGTSSKLSRSQ